MSGFANRVTALWSAAILAGACLHAQTVTISPGYVNLPLGGTQQYNASVTGVTPATVTWGVTGGGTITQTGLYTAPSTLPKGSVLVSATSTANHNVSTVVYVNSEGPGPTITAMTPNPLPVGTDTITITASASAPFIKGATAVCGGASMGATFISATSLSVVAYVGPSTSGYTCYVNNPGTWQSNSLTVPVGSSSSSAPVVSPATATVGLGGTQQFSANNVTKWAAVAGTITSAGLYTAPATTTASGTDTVTATGPGGSGTATVTLTTKPVISPATATVALGGTQQFSANNATKWAAAAGTITSAGLYTAPATMTSSGTDTVTATGPGGSGTATVTLTTKPVISPATATVALGGTQQFSASNVTKWAATAGTITSAGLYTAPATTTATGTDTVTATGSNGSGTATVTLVTKPVISPATATVALGGTQQFSANNVTKWAAAAGTITSVGLYTAPATTPATGTDTVTATGPGGSGTATVTLASPTAVSPATATVMLGATQQFTAKNATTWSATAGTVTSAGLYTAPASMTSSGTDTVTATGPGGKGTATVTLNYPAPVVTSLNPLSLPLGPFTATISGTGFLAQSTAALGGTPLIITAQGATSLSVTGFAGASGTLNLVVSNGSAASAPLGVQVGNPSALVSAAAARRFLEQAAFGPTPSDAANVQALGFQGWLNQQFAMPQVSNYNAEAASSQGGLPTQFLANAVTNSDQLRQKVAFALSQIFVVSITTDIWNSTMIPYEQLLMADAFTNYQQIMNDVTLSPAMGQYLDVANNAMGNPATGTIANQNYAREVMQLFTIGTTLLNSDGSEQLDGNSLPIPTYLQPVIADTARVLTGWTYQPNSGPVEWNANINPAGPMAAFPAEHDPGSKTLLNGYAEPANLSPQQDMSNALNNIFNHPNVGPFVGKLLIQHLVKSNPSPAYVQRVAAAFANNGSGVRGDMRAVITAILLDPEARANDNGGNDQPTDGHLQEPALFIAGMVRAFGGTMSNQNYFGWDLVNMSQDIYNPPSVFNYYAPTFVPPGSTVLGPEFQIFTPDAALWRANMVASFFFSWSNPVLNYGPGTSIDLTPFVPLATNPATLVAALDLTLTHGVMPAAMKAAIVTAVTNDTNGNLSRVETAAWLILTSNYYNVWH